MTHAAMGFSRWTTSVDCLLQLDYAVTIADVGTSESTLRKTWETGESPADYVQWFARKYDLISRDQWLRSALKDRFTVKP